MSGVDRAKQREEAKAWLARADDDLRAIQLCLDARPPVLGVAAYHCQQAAEKLIKGLLVLAAIAFRKTHDLDELSDLAVPAYPDAEPLLAHLRVRTYWGFAFRYPMPAESKSTWTCRHQRRSRRPCNGCTNSGCTSRPPRDRAGSLERRCCF